MSKESQYDNTNRIVLFKNETENDKAPMFKGSVDVDGKKFNVSIWKQESETQDCGYFLSGNIQPYTPKKVANGSKVAKKGNKKADSSDL